MNRSRNLSVLYVAEGAKRGFQYDHGSNVFTVATFVVLHSGGTSFEFRSDTSFMIRVYLVRLNLCRRIQR